MSYLHFVLTPTLWLRDEEGNFLAEISSVSGVWGNLIQKLNRKILAGETPITGIFYNYGKNINAKYDTQKRLMHVWVWKPNFAPTSPQELADLLYEASPEGGGPDGWMEGDLEILDTNDLRGFTTPESYGAELVPRIVQVY